MSEENATLMDTAGQTDELEIFDCKALTDYIKFKWTNYAGPIHKLGACFHGTYLLVYSIFIYEFYIYKTFQNRPLYLGMMMVALIYPTIYDFI